MAEGDAELPRWGGLTEPMTVATDVVIAVLAFVFAARLGFPSAEGSVARGWLAGAMLATGISAVIGAFAHGTSPANDALRDGLWRATVYVAGLIGATTIGSVAYFAARGTARTIILAFAAIKLVGFMYRATRRPEFSVVAADYGIALAMVLVGAVIELVRHRAPGMTWLIAGVLVSLVGGIVQARRVALHRHFNHNDLYHVIQMVALYAFYRGGALLVDR